MKPFLFAVAISIGVVAIAVTLKPPRWSGNTAAKQQPTTGIKSGSDAAANTSQAAPAPTPDAPKAAADRGVATGAGSNVNQGGTQQR